MTCGIYKLTAPSGKTKRPRERDKMVRSSASCFWSRKIEVSLLTRDLTTYRAADRYWRDRRLARSWAGLLEALRGAARDLGVQL